MLNRQGGVIDDLILYLRAPTRYRLVVNATTAERDLAWIREQAAGAAVAIRPRRDLAMIAVQGPKARGRAVDLSRQGCANGLMVLKPFVVAEQDDWFISRAGYTGEDGFELICPAGQASALWRGLKDAEVAPPAASGRGIPCAWRRV